MGGRTGGGEGEGEAGAALHAVAGVDRSLGGHLEGRPPTEEATLAGIGALGVLADDHEVAAGSERSGHADERPQVDVEVELEPQAEEQTALERPGRDGARPDGWADGAEQDGVGPPQLVEHAVGQDLAGADVAIGSEVVVGGLEGDTGGAHHLEGLGHHLGADAVPSDHCDPVSGHAVVPLSFICPALSCPVGHHPAAAGAPCRPWSLVRLARRLPADGRPNMEKPPTWWTVRGTHRGGRRLVDNDYLGERRGTHRHQVSPDARGAVNPAPAPAPLRRVADPPAGRRR